MPHDKYGYPLSVGSYVRICPVHGFHVSQNEGAVGIIEEINEDICGAMVSINGVSSLEWTAALERI